MSTDDLVESLAVKKFRRDLDEFKQASRGLGSALSGLFLSGSALEQKAKQQVDPRLDVPGNYARLVSQAKKELRLSYPLETLI